MDLGGTGRRPRSPEADAWRDHAIVWRNRALRLLDHVPLPIALCGTDGTILIVNRAMAAEFGLLPGQLRGRNAMEFFQLEDSASLRTLAEAVRLHRRSQYPIEVAWSAAGGVERCGEMTIDLVSDTPDETPNLLLSLRVLDQPAAPPATAAPGPAQVSPIEGRILAAAARGSTTAQIAREVDLTVDGVNYHLGRLSRRWKLPNRTALVARAFATGVLAPHTWPPAPAWTARQ